MEFLEIIIILIILCAQGYVAYLAWGQIETISHFLLSEDSLKLKQVSVELNEDKKDEYVYKKLSSSQYLGVVDRDITEDTLFSFSPKCKIKKGDKVSIIKGAKLGEAVIINIFFENSYVEAAFPGQSVLISLDHKVKEKTALFKIAELIKSPEAFATVSVISVAQKEKSILLGEVTDTINNYLKKNKGGAADFHLVKDIVERHTDSIDEEINHKLPVPIYLGLMGTVLGIIIGLFSLKFQFDPATNSLNGQLFVNSVSGLIKGVKLAMICSFVGLLLTTLLSSWRYMGAKSKLEAQKKCFL